MAHIILHSSELEYFKQAPLPDGTTILEKDKNEIPIKSYVLAKGQFILVTDFLEHQRDWNSNEERLKFESRLTKESVINFFINRKDALIPHREYRSFCNKELEYFKYIKHDGSYILLENKKIFNLFKIIVNKQDNLNEIKKEMKTYFKRIKTLYPELHSFEIKIFDHNLSKDGIYSLIVEQDKFKINRICRWESVEIQSFTSLDQTLQYLQQHHWYQ